MLPLSPDPTPRARAERMLAARIAIAVGLALLLVIGAWSTAHGPADAHASLCLAADVSTPGAATTPSAGDAASAPGFTAQNDDPGVLLVCVAVLCGAALALLLRFLLRRTDHPARVHASWLRHAGPTGPVAPPIVLSLSQLSISRT